MRCSAAVDRGLSVARVLSWYVLLLLLRKDIIMSLLNYGFGVDYLLWLYLTSFSFKNLVKHKLQEPNYVKRDREIHSAPDGTHTYAYTQMYTYIHICRLIRDRMDSLTQT